MNGFEWLDRLPAEQQHQLYQLMEAVSDGDNELVEAMTPALLDAAASDDQAWVEVFVRNFHLRSLVFNREDVKQALPQAVSLLERAHREDARDCPQSVCASHVLTAAYTLTDPVGYAARREAVSRETLDGLDPDRVCFLCISNEVAKALIDQGRADEALQLIERQKQIRRERGIGFDPDDFARTESSALLAVGRHDEALAVVDAGLESGRVYRGESWMNEVGQLRSWILASSGRGDEAAAELPELGQVFRDGGFEIHRRLVTRLVADGHLASLNGAVRLVHLAAEALERGLADTGIHASLDAASWLHQGGHPVLARAVFDRAMSHLDTLVDPARYEADMERFVSLDPIEPDAESIAAWSAAPTSADQLRGVADRWRQMGFADRADAVMADAAARFPDDVALYEERCRLAIRRRDGDALDALVAAPPDHPDGADNAGYYEGVFAHETGDRERAIAAFERVWARRRDWSDVARRLGTLLPEDDPRRSMEVWVQAADAHQAPYFRWLGLVGATLAEDWPAQARLGAELGLPELPDDRRVDLTWGYIRVRLPGLPRPLIAMRTGPVTARVLGLLPPGEAQHHGEIVVFDPEYGNADEVEADDEVLRVHDAWAGVEPATHDCVTLDGIWPGDEAVEALTDALDEAGVHYQYGAGEGYGITDPDGGETHRGLFLLLAVDDGSAPVVRDLFEAHRPGTGPWVYHELLDRLGERDEAERHRSLARAWAMI